MQSWFIYAPAIASPIAVLVAYVFLRSSAKQMRRRVAERKAAEASAPTPQTVHDALQPVETALETAVRKIIVGIEQSHARERSEVQQ